MSSFFSASFGFGQNKVQYQNLIWHYNKTPHFHSYYHNGQGALPPITAQWIENAYTELYKDFNFKHRKPVPLIVLGSPTLFEQTNVTPGIIPEGVGGFTESLKNRIVVPFSGSYEEFRHVLHHECVHAFQFGILFDQIGGSLFRSNTIQVPMWFAEGSAEYLSSGWDTEADMFMMDRTINGEIPSPATEMDGYMVYKGGQSFLFFLASTRGDSAFHRFLIEFKNTKQVINSLEQVYNQKIEDLGSEWQQELKRIYWPEIGKREDLKRKATAITSHIESRSFFNLKPRISPDGSQIAYYTDKKDYTKIFISDTKGKVIAKIGQYGYGGYFESFQPFRSGMCWSPKGDRLAFVTKNKGMNQIRIVDIKKKQRPVTLIPDCASISSPDWSNDGKSIVFCGLKEHMLDLYLIDIETQKLTRLTNDIRFESSPRFSRDGSSIIFAATDTCGLADRKTNAQRPYSNIYSLNLSTDSITRLTYSNWNETFPCFSPDGNSIAFISDRTGINNIYIAPFASLDSARALTNVVGGCSTPDWSAGKNTIVFDLFEKQGWDIWLIDEPTKKCIDSIPAPTQWIASLRDTSAHYFTPGVIPPDTADSAGSITTIDEHPSIFETKAPGQKKKNLELGIIEEVPKDTLINTPTAAPDSTVSIPIQNAAIIDTSDSLKQTSHIDSTISIMDSAVKTVSPSTDSAQSTKAIADSNLITPVLPRLIDYPYTPKFTVDVVSLGMAYSTMYGYAGQGVVVFSDLLGNHQIAVAGNIQGSFEENNIFGFYLNTRYRLDFGLGGFYEKYYTFATLDYYNVFHDTNMGGMMLLRYPFSIFSRIDANFFYQHVQRQPYIYENGHLTKNDSIPSSDENVTLPSLSYVFDNILWGITGPVNGIRADATFQASTPINPDDASFIALDVDVRHYWHIRKRFVWANRIACGFSEPVNREESAKRYFLGGNENWIFYEVNRDAFEKYLSHTTYSSIVTPFRGWNYFDISGTRYAVLNTEFRFPFIKTIDVVWPLPMTIQYINGAFFADIGNAWDPEDQYESIPLPKKIYGGMGFGFRANFGIFILRYDLAWKTDWRRYMKDAQNYWSLGAEF